MREITYSAKLKHPFWHAKRLQILERDNYKCQECGIETNLHVHHKIYIDNREPWDYHHLLLVTLCENCHEKTHKRLKRISQRLGFMSLEQLYFSVDVISMLQLAKPEECLKILEFTTSLLKERIHE